MVRAWMATPLALMMFPTAQAAEPGFYVGASVSRAEQKLDGRAGSQPFSSLAPPVFGFLPCSTVVCGGFIIGTPNPVNPVVGILPYAPLPDRVEVDDSDTGWSAMLGYRVNDYFAGEVAYVDFGAATLTQYYAPVTIPGFTTNELTRTSKVSVRGPTFSVLGSFPLSESWSVFVRGAVLFADQEVKRRVTTTNPVFSGSDRREFNDEVISAGAGVQWSFLPRWTARLEYQRTDDLQENNFTGESRLEQAALSVLFKL